MPTPYLLRPLRSLEQAEAEIQEHHEAAQIARDMETARRRMSFLRKPAGLRIEPALPLDYAKKLKAREDGLAHITPITPKEAAR